MKNWKSNLQIGAWFTLILLLIPPLWYSLRTPFALIDDYNSWMIVRSFSHVSGIILWFQDTWVHTYNRFRITFDMYDLVTWALLGGNHTLHHAMRWVLKAIVVWSTFNILRLMVSDWRSEIGLSFWVFCVLYIFFPNNPEARLAPTELLTVTFLALLFYELSRLFVRARGDLKVLGLRRYLWVIFVFTAMLWVKETNIVIGMVALMMLVCLNLKRWMRLLPFVVIVLITGIRVWAEKHAGGYGTAPITLELIHKNIVWYNRWLFLRDTSWVCSLSLLVPLLAGVAWLVIQTWKTRLVENRWLWRWVLWLQTHPILTFCWLVFLSMLSYYAIVLISWELVPRYFYPVVYLLALWIGLILLAVEAFPSRWRLAVTGLVIVASVYFIGANYYNFIYQFANQYYTRIVEQDVLRTSDRLLRDGRTVTLTMDGEFEDKINNYFNDYLPYYKQTGYRIKIGPVMPPNDGCYYVSRSKMTLPAGHQSYRCFDHRGVSKILWWCDRISSWFQFGRPAFQWEDAGAPYIGRHGEEMSVWYMYDCHDIWKNETERKG